MSVHQCMICEESFLELNDLHTHQKSHDHYKDEISNCKEEIYLCQDCPDTFKILDDLEIHSKMHIKMLDDGNKALHQCTMCTETFLQYCELELHCQIHVKTKNTTGDIQERNNVVCEDYNQSFKIDKFGTVAMEASEIPMEMGMFLDANKTVDIEEKTDEDEKSVISATLFQCRVCDQSFSQYSDLEIHCTTHIENFNQQNENVTSEPGFVTIDKPYKYNKENSSVVSQPKKAMSSKERGILYRERQKSSRETYEKHKKWDAERNRLKRKQPKTSEQLHQQREKTRLRVSACRERKKTNGIKKHCTPSKPFTRREDGNLLRERNKLSQRKRRANMSEQKKLSEKMKKARYYQQKKSLKATLEEVKRQKVFRAEQEATAVAMSLRTEGCTFNKCNIVLHTSPMSECC